MSLLSDYLNARGVICVAITEEEDYHGEHKAPSTDDAPLYDLSVVYPDDIYTGRGSDYAQEPSERYGLAEVLRCHNKPWARVQVFRAVPKDIKGAKINPGDWVTLSRQYAKEHGLRSLGGPGKYKILTLNAYARDLYTNGDSLAEWGYNPRPATAEEEAELSSLREAKDLERIKRASTGEKIISINKYPEDPYYGKPDEFFTDLLAQRQAIASEEIPDTIEINAATNYQDDTEYAPDQAELTKLGLIFGQPQSKNDGIQVTYKGHTLEIRPDKKEIELSPAVPASRGRKYVPASVKDVPGFAVTGITPKGSVTNVLRAEDAEKWLRGLKAYWDRKQ